MKKNFRFFDNRQKYLLFVTTTNEKNMISDALKPIVQKLKPQYPSLKIFDAGMGDGSLLMSVMRQCHQKMPQIPLLVSTKEISMEDVRLGLEKLPDRFVEHKNTVFVISNLNYVESTALKSNDKNSIKFMCQDYEELSKYPHLKKIIDYFNSDKFLSILEKETGIQNLISDNDLSGGGLHLIGNGGFLKVHADFNIAENLPTYFIADIGANHDGSLKRAKKLNFAIDQQASLSYINRETKGFRRINMATKGKFWQGYQGDSLKKVSQAQASNIVSSDPKVSTY